MVHTGTREYQTQIELEEIEVIAVLYNINRCITTFEYPTSNMVMSVIESACMSLFAGKGLILIDEESEELRRRSVYEMLDTLVRYCNSDADRYYWFLYWVEKMQERQLENETEWDFEEGEEEYE